MLCFFVPQITQEIAEKSSDKPPPKINPKCFFGKEIPNYYFDYLKDEDSAQPCPDPLEMEALGFNTSSQQSSKFNAGDEAEEFESFGGGKTDECKKHIEKIRFNNVELCFNVNDDDEPQLETKSV